MKRLIWHWAISALALWLTTLALHGVTLAHWYDYLWIAPLLGLVNVVVGTLAKILSFFAFPINLMTLGCFGFLLSFIFYIAAIWYLGNQHGPLYPTLTVTSISAAMYLAVVMALFGSLLNMLLPGKSDRRG